MQDLQLQKSSRKRKIIVAIIVIVTIIILVSLLKFSKPDAPTPNVQEQLPLVNTAKLSYTQMAPTFTTIGKISASSISDIQSQVRGQVKAVYVNAGQRVAKDQPLLSIDPVEQERHERQTRAQFELAKANLAQGQAQHNSNLALLVKDKELSALATRSLKRYQDLQKRQLATDAQVDQANEVAQRQASSTITRQTLVDNWPSQLQQLTAQLEAAQANQDQAQLDLASTEIKSPFDGVVSQVLVANSGRVVPNQSLISLHEQQSLALEVSMPQDTMAYLQLMARSQKIPASALDLQASGTILGKTVEFKLKTFSQNTSAAANPLALFTPINDDINLPLNRAVEVQVQLPRLEKAYRIPVTALHDHSYIYLLDDQNKLHRQDIQLLGETYVYDKAKSENRRFYLIAAQTIKSGAQFVTSQMVRNVNGVIVQPTLNSTEGE